MSEGVRATTRSLLTFNQQPANPWDILVFSVPTDVINLCGKIQIRKSRHYGG